MHSRIIKRDCTIIVRSTLREVSRHQQGVTHNAVPYHERNSRPLLLGQRQELLCKLARQVAVERQAAGEPEAVENGEQQQRVFGRLSDGFSLFDQQTRTLCGRLGFRRGIPLDVHEGSCSAT